jgi:hypothetical protein
MAARGLFVHVCHSNSPVVVTCSHDIIYFKVVTNIHLRYIFYKDASNLILLNFKVCLGGVQEILDLFHVYLYH